LLPIQKSAAKSFDAVDFEIGSQVLCRCRSINRQQRTLMLSICKSAPRTAPLPIHKSATSNCFATDSKICSQNCFTTDSEIDNLKLCRCQFRNPQPKALLLPILKSAAK